MSQLIIKMFDKEGLSFFVPYIYASDIEGEPFKHSFIQDQMSQLLCQLSEKPLFLNVLWEVEGFGKLIMTANNEGRGYKKGEFETSTVLNLNYELAKSHLKKVEDTYETHYKTGSIFSDELPLLLDESRSYLELANNTANEVEKAHFSDKALNSSLWVGEKLILEIARMDIERFRKVNVTLKVVDKNGNPIKNAFVIANQLTHDFMFACQAKGIEKDSPIDFEIYKKKHKELFNSGAVSFFWPSFEPEANKFQWESRDSAVNWLYANGLRIWGHLLIWIHIWSVPDWAKRKKSKDLNRIFYRLCYEPVHRYRDKIKLWNVFNEPEWGNVLELSVDQQLEFIELGMNATKEANKDIVRFINPTICWGEYAAWGRTAEGSAKRNLLTPYQFLKKVNEKGIKYDALGLQLYMGFGGIGSAFSIRDMLTISELLDKYAQLGKPIHITELGVPSKFFDDKKAMSKGVREAGYWHKPWDEENQADWVEQFYTIAYSKPYIESISWFELAEYPHHFVPWGGLLHEDLSPKESYNRLKQLLCSWMTKNTGITNSHGEYSFKGFKGSYKITIKKDEYIITDTEKFINTNKLEIIQAN